jgi:hypothetical protein
MLFLSSPRGVGIASTIELSVVIGTTSVPLLSLLRFGGFGINESQPPVFSGEAGFRLHYSQGNHLLG